MTKCVNASCEVNNATFSSSLKYTLQEALSEKVTLEGRAANREEELENSEFSATLNTEGENTKFPYEC